MRCSSYAKTFSGNHRRPEGPLGVSVGYPAKAAAVAAAMKTCGTPSQMRGSRGLSAVARRVGHHLRQYL
jgi:hypothetical protein